MSWRYELKFLVPAEVAQPFKREIDARLVPGEFVDERGGYPVLSQYYDGDQLPFYREKVIGIENRHKVRLRTYDLAFTPPAVSDAGAASPRPPWFLEVKRKRNQSIGKRRLLLEPDTIDPTLPASWNVLAEREDAHALLALRELHRLQPSAGVWYRRTVHQSADAQLRITWDDDVIGLYPGESMRSELLHDHRRWLWPPDVSILEIKTAQRIPRWLANRIAKARLMSQAVSKYVGAVNRLGLSRRVMVTC